jgi:DNA-binding SARP family transcriptional activator
VALEGRITVLGEFALAYDGEHHRLWHSAERLVVLLAVHHRDRRARRAVVAERLWPDSSPARAASNLRSVLWRLPRPRGRALVLGDASSTWLSEELGVDLWDAEDGCAALRDVQSVELLPDLGPLHHDLVPDLDEPWLALERESFRQKRLHALERASEVLCRCGRFTDALEAGLGAVRSEPLRESAHRRVIEVHLAEGNHAEALRQYDGYRRLLAHELGLRPTDTIRRLVAPLLGRPVDSHPSGDEYGAPGWIPEVFT